MRPVAAVLLLSLLALAAGASAAEDLSSGADASAPTGAVLIARKVRFLGNRSHGFSVKKKRTRKLTVLPLFLCLSLQYHSLSSPFLRSSGGTRP